MRSLRRPSSQIFHLYPRAHNYRIRLNLWSQEITTLKSKFDYIILDTTPAGIVADAFQMMKHASQILVVCRNNYTRKDVFIEVINNLQSNKFANYDVVFNDLDLKRSQIGAYNSYYHKE